MEEDHKSLISDSNGFQCEDTASSPGKASKPVKRPPLKLVFVPRNTSELSQPSDSSPAPKRDRSIPSSSSDVPLAKRRSHHKIASMSSFGDALKLAGQDPIRRSTPTNEIDEPLHSSVPRHSKAASPSAENIPPKEHRFERSVNQMGSRITRPSPRVSTGPMMLDTIANPYRDDYLGGTFNHPDADKHNSWSPLAVQTAKCDHCDKNKRHVLQKCDLCSLQVCKQCISDAKNTRLFERHEVDLPNLRWDVPKKKTSSIKPKRSTISHPQSTFRPQFQSPATTNFGESLQEDILEHNHLRQTLDYDPRHVASMHGHAAYGDPELFQRGLAYSHPVHANRRVLNEQEIASYIPTRTQHFDPAIHHEASTMSSVQVMPSFSSHEASFSVPSVPSVPSVNAQKLGLTPEDIQGIQGETVDEILNQIFKIKQERAQREQKERDLQSEVEQARQGNEHVLRMIATGDVEGAENMLEAASTLLRMQRDLGEN